MTAARAQPIARRRVAGGRATRRQWRWRALAGRLAYAVLGIVLGCSIAWLLTGDGLRVREVAVYGTQLLPTDEVLARLDVEGRHPLWLRPAELAARLRTLPEVSEAQVEVFAPGIVEVSVVERRPALLWVVAGETWLVDEQGLALRPAVGAWPGLPIVYHAAEQSWSRGQQLNPRVVGNALRLGRFVAGNFEPGTSLVHHDLVGLVVVGPTWQALLDPGGDLARQHAALRALRARRDLAGEGGAMYDVRFPDRGYVRPLPAIATPPHDHQG